MHRFALFVVFGVVFGGLVACGSNVAPGMSGDDDAAPVDAAPSDASASLEEPARGFQIKTPTVDVAPGAEVTYCYYFRTPNASELAIKKWASRMTQGSHHMILYLTPGDKQPPGTMSTQGCGTAGSTAIWTYSAQTPDAEAALPADDGAGTPVGQLMPANRAGFLLIHYLNASDLAIHPHVELNAYAYDEGVQVTPAAPYSTFNTKIDIDPGSTEQPALGMVNGNCTVSPTSKFYILSTHTHKQGVHTFVKDGATTIYDSTDWQHPGEKRWPAAPFYSFTSGKLTYQCEYENTTNRRIFTGDSSETDETCVAVGYYFPAPGGVGHGCQNDTMSY